MFLKDFRQMRRSIASKSTYFLLSKQFQIRRKQICRPLDGLSDAKYQLVWHIIAKGVAGVAWVFVIFQIYIHDQNGLQYTQLNFQNHEFLHIHCYKSNVRATFMSKSIHKDFLMVLCCVVIGGGKILVFDFFMSKLERKCISITLKCKIFVVVLYFPALLSVRNRWQISAENFKSLQKSSTFELF